MREYLEGFLSYLTHYCTVFCLLQVMDVNSHLPLQLEPNTSGMHSYDKLDCFLFLWNLFLSL